MKTVIKIITAFSLVSLSAAASAQLLDFEDLANTHKEITSYHGFTFQHFSSEDINRYAGGGAYSEGATSGTAFLFNPWEKDASIVKTGGGLFDFGSASLRAAWNQGLNITVTGWLNGVEVSTKTVTVNSTEHTLGEFNFLGIDKLTFHSYGGVKNPLFTTGSGTHFMIDDMNFAAVAPVPEPSTYAMMFAGLGLVGLMARRRRSSI